ncbi:hypothetical protein [Borreliella bavariensis]|uniref:hypothetical protein n=1 Tax=Borreliella bavariensis TaxID=664662 RepID=UPI001C0219F3|nr:hypothetical protein [Borreliella bavariensis]
MCDTTNILCNIYYITKTIFVNFLQEFYKKNKDFLKSIAKELNKAYGFSLAEFALKNYFFKSFLKIRYSTI